MVYPSYIAHERLAVAIMSGSMDNPLKSYTMGGLVEGYHLIARVVSIDPNDELSLPVQELWAKRDVEVYDIEYMLYTANSPHDITQEQITLEQADWALKQSPGGPGPWIRTLYRSNRKGRGCGPSWWLPTRLVRAEESIWKLLKCHTMIGTNHFIIDERNLENWLELCEKNEEPSADEDDDEAVWTSYSTDEEAAARKAAAKKSAAKKPHSSDGEYSDGEATARGAKKGRNKNKSQAKKTTESKDQDKVMGDVDAMPNNNGGKSEEAVMTGPSVDGQFSLPLRSHWSVVIDEGYEADREYGVTSMPVRGGRVF
jgi:hypothetical protein